MHFNDGKIRVWRRKRERFTDATIRENVRFGRGSVMVWGGISLHHQTEYLHHPIQGNLTGQRYLNEVIIPVALPALQTIGDGAMLQDDNARPHRAMMVNTFLQD